MAEATKQDPNAYLFTSLWGARYCVGPRLLCAFGSQPDSWANADSVAAFSGIVPVTKIEDSLVQSIFVRRSTNSRTAHDYTVSGQKPAMVCYVIGV